MPRLAQVLVTDTRGRAVTGVAVRLHAALLPRRPGADALDSQLHPVSVETCVRCFLVAKRSLPQLQEWSFDLVSSEGAESARACSGEIVVETPDVACGTLVVVAAVRDEEGRYARGWARARLSHF